MKNIAVICAGSLPVPSVKGGAVETGVQQLIDINEVEQLCHFIIYSKYDKEAVIKSKEYKYSSFVFIDEPKNASFVVNIRKIVNKVICLCISKERLPILRPWFINAICKDLSQRAVDIILVKNCPNYIKKLKKVSKAKLALQLHNDFLSKDMYKAEDIASYCDAIVVNSTYIGNRVKTIDNIAQGKIRINLNCTDVSKFDRTKLNPDLLKEFRTKYGLCETDIVIVYTGRMNRQKGVNELLDAVALLPNSLSIKLLLVGSNWFGRNKNDRFIKEIKRKIVKLCNRVILTGYISYDMIPYTYGISDICVVPSQWEEPAGRVVIEAQASGMATIISDAGGMMDYTTEGAAIIIKRGKSFSEELAKTLELLITNPEYRNTIAEVGKEYVQRFTPDAYYKDIMRILLSLD